MLQGSGQGLHGRAWQLQAFEQGAVGQQVALATGQVKLAKQTFPVLAADPYAAHDGSLHPATPSSQARLRRIAASGWRSPLSIRARYTGLMPTLRASCSAASPLPSRKRANSLKLGKLALCGGVTCVFSTTADSS
ncbi:hypothetical protein D3C79_877680 [compost metagenome]